MLDFYCYLLFQKKKLIVKENFTFFYSLFSSSNVNNDIRILAF